MTLTFVTCLYEKEYLLGIFIVNYLTACSTRSANNIADPLPTYWQVNDKNYNDIDYQIKKKLKEIEDKLYKIDLEMDRLKEPEWHKNVHSIYSNIQKIRNKSIEPMKTFNEDDI